ncbi:MAG TPA: hypothetical protein VIG51_08680 [Candidatus Baltobacteraceae bacterium]
MNAALASCYMVAEARYRHVSALAPADEYFGRMKMSVLEIANRLRDSSLRAEQPSSTASSIMHDTQMTENAIADWERKYPRDPWLAKDVARLVHIYAKLDTPPAMRRMHACMAWLAKRYGRSRGLVAAERVEVSIADAHLNHRP